MLFLEDAVEVFRWFERNHILIDLQKVYGGVGQLFFDKDSGFIKHTYLRSKNEEQAARI